MNLTRHSATLATLCFFARSLGWGAGCKHALSVAEVVRNAQALDGQIVCLRGLLTPIPVPQWSTELFQELLPLQAARPTPSPADRLGLEDWWPESGIDEQYYKPESFAMLTPADFPMQPVAPHQLDVTLRAAVMYKRNLRANIPPLAPGEPQQIEAMRRARYDVELVLLEIVKARRVGNGGKGSKSLSGVKP
jgi:hypothetical protein